MTAGLAKAVSHTGLSIAASSTEQYVARRMASAGASTEKEADADRGKARGCGQRLCAQP